MKEKPDNRNMKVMGGEYFTVQDMAKSLDVTPKVVNMRLFRLGIKPISRDALYPITALDAIRDITMGRPKKAPDATAGKKPPVETKASKGRPLKQPVKVKKQQS
jgi:hypothetical protein